MNAVVRLEAPPCPVRRTELLQRQGELFAAILFNQKERLDVIRVYLITVQAQTDILLEALQRDGFGLLTPDEVTALKHNAVSVSCECSRLVELLTDAIGDYRHV